MRRLKRVRVWKMARFVEPETLLADQEGGGGGSKEDGCRAHGTDQSAPMPLSPPPPFKILFQLCSLIIDGRKREFW